MRDKGSGGLYQDARGLWTAAVELPPDHTGRRRRKVIRRKNKRDALTALRDARKELERAGDLPTASPTVNQWMTLWLDRIAAPRLKPRTLATYRSYTTQHIVPAIGRIRLDKLTPDHVRRVHEHITSRGLSPTTALQAHRILAKALEDAVREGRISQSPTEHMDAPRRAVAVRPALSADDARHLLLSCPPSERARWSVALLAGLRQGEALGITTEALNLDTGMLTVSWQLQRLPYQHGCRVPCGRRRGGDCPDRRVTIPPDQEVRHVSGGLWLTRPKSRAGWRQVPLAPPLWRALLEHDGPPGMQGLVFARPDGRPVDPKDDAAAWDAALRAAGLPDVPLHSARHTTATLLHALGVDSDTRQQILGHSSATVTAGYTHISTPVMREAMGLLGGLIEGPAANPRKRE